MPSIRFCFSQIYTASSCFISSPSFIIFTFLFIPMSVTFLWKLRIESLFFLMSETVDFPTPYRSERIAADTPLDNSFKISTFCFDRQNFPLPFQGFSGAGSANFATARKASASFCTSRKRARRATGTSSHT